MKLKRIILITGFTATAASPTIAQKAPQPCGLTPSARQIEWYNREMIAFFHFGINTFEDFVNEGDGKAPTAIFSPTALDCGQWMETLKSAGIPAAILTAKHADGFCLWPSQYTDYCVKNATWKAERVTWCANSWMPARSTASKPVSTSVRTTATSTCARTTAPKSTNIIMPPSWTS